jgi:hypothetical protein
MIDFCPDGYVPLHEAMFTAAKVWYPEQISALVRAFSQWPIPAAWQDDAWRHAFANIWSETAHRLRYLLHQGTLKVYYFNDSGCQHLSREFWATAKADGVIESGTYWPFSKPSSLHESRPYYSLFLLQSDVDALLSDQPAKKRPFPGAKMPELVAALRKLDDLPNRAAQLQALSNMPEFREFTITNILFRQAAKKAGPRRAGRKSQR